MATSQSLAQALSEIIDYDPYGNVITPQPTSSTSLLGNTTNTANQVRRIPNSFEGDSSDVPGLSPQTLGFLAQETPYDNEGRMISIDRGLNTIAGFLPVAGFVNQLPTYLSSPIVGAIASLFGGKQDASKATLETAVPTVTPYGQMISSYMGNQDTLDTTINENGEVVDTETGIPVSSSGSVAATDDTNGYADFAHGGKVNRSQLRGPDPKGPDEGYASLQSGEYVIKRDAVRKYGDGMLGKINSGKFAKR
jgi:hypothetical protein